MLIARTLLRRDVIGRLLTEGMGKILDGLAGGRFPQKSKGGMGTWGRMWARELGTICPFGVFSLFNSNFWPKLRPIHVARPIVAL